MCSKEKIINTCSNNFVSNASLAEKAPKINKSSSMHVRNLLKAQEKKEVGLFFRDRAIAVKQVMSGFPLMHRGTKKPDSGHAPNSTHRAPYPGLINNYYRGT
jgi:hypothetical protein